MRWKLKLKIFKVSDFKVQTLVGMGRNRFSIAPFRFAQLTACLLLTWTSFPAQAQWEKDTFHVFKRIAYLPSDLNEISGMVLLNNGNLLAINDGGNPAELIELTVYEGKIVKKYPLNNAVNVDWEAVAKDRNSNMLYIGDFGNNDNTRKDLCIYVVHEDSIQHPETALRKISFSYENQTSFPPAADSMWFDAEAMYYHRDTLWIITKNRSRPFDGRLFMYSLPLREGDTLIARLNNVLKYTDGNIRELEWVTDAFYDYYQWEYGVMLLNHTKVIRTDHGLLKIHLPDGPVSKPHYSEANIETLQQFEAIVQTPVFEHSPEDICYINCYLMACESSPFGQAALYILDYGYLIQDAKRLEKEVPFRLTHLSDGSLHLQYPGAFSLEIYGLDGKLLFSQSAHHEIQLNATLSAKRPFVLHLTGEEGSVHRLVH